MFMFSNEKNRLLDEVETLRGRVAVLESYIRNLKLKDWEIEKQHRYGSKLDGTPKAKPGRKPSK